jgi:hypothetical protein
MKEQLDLVKILKDCPKGMELDCTMYDNVTLKSVSDDADNIYPICIEMKCGFIARLTKYGQNACINDAKCVIFPKGKTTWDGFHRPFIDGDIVISDKGDIHLLRTSDSSYCAYRERWCGLPKFDSTITTSVKVDRFATEEEKQKLFDAIKANGYKWNPETKTLEKLIVPKFKVGTKIIHKSTGLQCTLGEYAKGISAYRTNIGLSITHEDLEQWELAPNKFDPKTLQPFDKVLVRYIGCDTYWQIQFFETMYECNKHYPIRCLGGKLYSFCIPYNDDTKHLVNKMDDAPEFYRYWED